MRIEFPGGYEDRQFLGNMREKKCLADLIEIKMHIAHSIFRPSE